MKEYLESAIKQFRYYKLLAEKSIAQIPDDRLSWKFNDESNSISTIVRHLSGNMRSRWTDFLTTDGEKEWRDRESEFGDKPYPSRAALLEDWEAGWSRLFTALESITPADYDTLIYIRNQGHTITDAVNRQLAHYPYHVGQIVYIARMVASSWESLSIPRGASAAYNAEKFAAPKRREHFTDEILKGNDKA